MSDTSDGVSGRRSDKKHRGVYEHPQGSDVFWVVYFDEHGRRHREKVGPKGLALKVYQKRKNEIQERRFFPERIRRRDVLLKTFIEEYLDRVRPKLRSVRNHERYGVYWSDALGSRALRQIIPGDVERYVAKRRADGMAPASINRELAFLKRVFSVAGADGLVDSNPVRAVRFFRENNARVRYLRPEEEQQLCKALPTEHWPKVAVALHTGFRQGNQFRLRWTDVNFDIGLVRAHQPKSGEDYFVPMSDDLRTVLRALPSRMRSEWVFPSETGDTPLDAKNFLHRVFAPALKQAKITDLRWHDLRHTFASRLVMAGVDARTVQTLMGHKTLAMTERYAHLSPAHKLAAVQRLNRPTTDEPTATTTAIEPETAKVAVGSGAEVVELPREPGGRRGKGRASG